MAKERLVTCEECGTANTPLWRKDDRNRNLCNACGIRWKRSLTSKSKKNVLLGIVKPKPTEYKHKSSPSKISALSGKTWAMRTHMHAFDAFEQLIAAAETEYLHDFSVPSQLETDQLVASPQPELLVPASPAHTSAYASSAEEEGVTSDVDPQHHISAPLPALPSVLLQRGYSSLMTA